MISKKEMNRINDFKDRVTRFAAGQMPTMPTRVEKITTEDRNQIDQEQLIPRLVGLPENRKAKIIDVAHASMDEIEAEESQRRGFTTEERRHRMRWLKGAEGFLDLLAKTSVSEILPASALDLAYDLVKRLVMWARSDCNLWRFAQWHADQIREVAWGPIDYLL
jgi:hypothetical protein